MRFVWATARKDFSRLRRDPVLLLVALGIPLILGGLLSIVFGGGAAAPHGLLLVDDEDGTLVSKLFVAGFQNGSLAKMITVENVGRDGGLARINRGDGSALLIIPKGLETAYFANKPFRMELRTNPSQRILPNIIEENLSIMSEAAFYLQQMTGGDFALLKTPRAPNDQTVAFAAVAVNHLVTNLRGYLNPPLIGLDVSVAVGQPRPSFAVYFFPSLIFMALLFIANGLSADIWRERARGTLRRVAVMPVSLEAFLAGRVLFVGVVLIAVAAASLLASRWAGAPVSNVFACMVWLVLSGTALFELVLLAKLYAPSERTSSVIGNLVILPLAFLGGSFFPFDTMPPWMADIGRKTPNGWAMTEFQKILSGSVTSFALLPALGMLIAVSAVVFFLAARRLRHGFLL